MELENTKGVVSINGVKINAVNMSMSAPMPVIINDDSSPISSMRMEATITLKINRWNRFKMWWFVFKQRFVKVKEYNVSMKWEK